MNAQANRRLVRRLLLTAAAMFGFGFALVPLYNVFCEITGLNGKTAAEAVAVAELEGAVDTRRTVTVQFLANVNAGAPWSFAPAVARMQVHPGELYRTRFVARNLGDAALVGQAVPSVAPGRVAEHFQKIECFCFRRQAFGPGEEMDMPLVFRLDPRIPADVSTVTLSYTFFRLEEAQGG